MDPKFYLPIGTMLAGLALWLAFLFARGVFGGSWPAWLLPVVTAVSAALILFSAFT